MDNKEIDKLDIGDWVQSKKTLKKFRIVGYSGMNNGVLNLYLHEEYKKYPSPFPQSHKNFEVINKRKITKKELIKRLKDIGKWGTDIEVNHIEADTLLTEFIDDKEITKAYKNIKKWYS